MLLRSVSAIALFAGMALPAMAADALPNHFVQTNFVGNSAKFSPELVVEPNFINAWGIAIRPKGAGGHFWVTAKDVSYQYVGDVSKSADESLRKLQALDVKYVKLPVGGDDKFATGVVFSESKTDFVITQEVKGVEPVTAPAKFLFSSDGGVVSAWTERKKSDGTFDRAEAANNVIDQSKEGAQFFGIALNHDSSRIYLADFGKQPTVKVFNGKFQPVSIAFDMPFDSNKNGKVDPGEFAPFNIQGLTLPSGDHHMFVTYAMTQACPDEAIKKGECAKGELFAGEEDTSKVGNGRLAEFTEDGKLVAVWKDGGNLMAPWGMTIAPADKFGALSGKLLVGNFGSGTIAAFDLSTHEFVDVMRSAGGKPVVIEKIWGILFGNGESLGDTDALYFAAGPEDEKMGVFGRLKLAAEKM